MNHLLLIKRGLFFFVAPVLVTYLFLSNREVDLSTVHGEVIEYGIYNYGVNQSDSWQSDAATSPTVYENARSLTLTKETTQIPIIKDIGFGFSHRIEGLPVGIYEFDWSVKHPDMNTKHKGESYWYTYKRTIISTGGPIENFDGYILNKEYEMVPGEWQFTYRYNGKVIVSQRFTTYLPEAEPKTKLTDR